MFQVNMDLLSDVVPKFHDILKEDEGQKWKNDREDKDEFFSAYFTKDQLPTLDEGTLRELIHILWAFDFWTNKDYILQEMLKSGLDKIRKAFEYLLYSNDPISKRWDFIRANVRMMGAACISEILTHRDPKEYPIWNTRSKVGLIVLGVPEKSLPKSSQISGSQYQAFCDLVEDVRKQIEGAYPEFLDLFVLDFLLYFISVRKPKALPPIIKEPITPILDFEHDAVVDQVLELGDGLGFEVQKEVKITHGCRIDAIWRSRIANLGTISYAFEVHRKGSRDSAILNLQRVKRDPSIQKVVIVSTEEELSKFREDITSLDENFRNSLGYFTVDELQEALNHLGSLKDILKILGLLSVEPFST